MLSGVALSTSDWDIPSSGVIAATAASTSAWDIPSSGVIAATAAATAAATSACVSELFS